MFSQSKCFGLAMTLAAGALLLTTGWDSAAQTSAQKTAPVVQDKKGEGDQGDKQNGQAGDQGEKQNGQAGDQGEKQNGQVGDPGDKQSGQTGDQGDKKSEKSAAQNTQVVRPVAQNSGKNQNQGGKNENQIAKK